MGDTFEYTSKPGAHLEKGWLVVHAHQGGGPATQGRYFLGLTWCGAEESTKSALVPTDDAITCKRCLKALKALEVRNLNRGQ